MADSIERAALAYLARGWSVIPVHARDKRPIIAWQPYQQQPPTIAVARGWFHRWPTANLAIVTGTVSGLVVVDVDPRHGGTESLAELEQEHGAVRDTVEAISGGGGRHLYFAHPGGTVVNRAGIEPGIDLRGDGGRVVAQPSGHATGNRYRWRPGHAPGEVALAPLPGWLLQSLGQRTGHSLAYWRELVGEGVTEGSRNTTIASLAGHLLWHGLDESVITELLLCWNRVRCRPPLDDDEVVRTVASVGRSHRRGDWEPPGTARSLSSTGESRQRQRIIIRIERAFLDVAYGVSDTPLVARAGVLMPGVELKLRAEDGAGKIENQLFPRRAGCIPRRFELCHHAREPDVRRHTRRDE